ncbi:aldo/keto reductase [Erysipelatoclostridium sp. An173]|uniref:aldo/keto reductase n=1 Tax=Erysipelatoclostridium sp. An173 TaxID=1965571 RepID=UPI000B3A6AB0|nr:aldo/keto reductase [Erysipelatoclostridium sp. An173]OUP75645.1 aldo/keto reductase [Erysipelatoclostridium sp. An173]
MEKRELGKSGLVTSKMGFGCMGLNYHRGVAKDRNEMIKVVHEAIDAGITMFDTAAVYGPYTNEELVGDALVGYRDKVQIATKGGFKIDGLNNELDSRPESLRKQLEDSLKRLKTDYIDLYYIHRVDPNVPIEDVAMAMKQFKKEGLIKHWGLSEAGVETIRRAHKVEPLAAVEYEYSMWWREIEKDVLPVLEELGIGLVAYSPLGRGFLTGKLDKNTTFGENDNRADLPRFTKEAMAANQVVIDYINELAIAKNATAAQIALAWVMAQKPWIVPIPGTTKISRIHENIKAANIKFSDEEMKTINDALSKIEIVGDRYPESEKRRTGN